MTIKKVALVGANGKLGPAIISALHAANFPITVLSRTSSKSTYPPFITTTTIPDDPTVSDLIPALRGQDALVVIFAGSNADLQIRLADAAVHAGVKRFIPADFGSCDSSSPRALELMPLYRAKLRVREYLQSLGGTGLTWTSLVCGHFFDYGLESGLLSFDIHTRTARIFDGGEIKWSATTIGFIALAVVRVLQREEETRDRMLYIQSFSVTQNEVLRVLKDVTRREWHVDHVDSGDFIKKVKAEVDQDPNDSKARENLVSVVGIVDAIWEGKEDFANDLLGLQGESLEKVVRDVVGR